MSRTPIHTPNIPVLSPSDEFLRACERLLAERGTDGNVQCLGRTGPGRQFDDGGLRIAALTQGHDAGALDIELTFAAGAGHTVCSPAIQRLPGARLTHVHTHWVYGRRRLAQYQLKTKVQGPIQDTPYEASAQA
jgi:hypothetical protein